MNKVYLLTGGNMGDRKNHLEMAAKKIENVCGKIVISSPVYETDAWGKTDQPNFYNQALLLHTALSPLPLLKHILQIEFEMGRSRLEKYGPRIIDIDILLFNDEKMEYPDLKIPHPELANRRFALAPLNAIAAGTVHPVLKKTISRLLNECPDGLEVHKLEN
ncbi:MAG TPA: 2-amino-4-hydroxy-6-hydroxymethyldihydropteridine diphosphokinase [Agriterribacter sp.]|nr:2-amino-4-hydroxy-6-hydroxymethyldihydropteridine diphosphokinase [Agriterribacter sp.]